MAGYETLQAGEKTIRIKAFGEDKAPAVLYCLTGDDPDEQVTALEQIILPEIERGACRPFYLTWCGPVDWNAEYTPWPAPALSKKDVPFAGAAEKTLAWLQDGWMPKVQQTIGESVPADNSFLLGYSLGGLCALWMAYTSALFAGHASCSGSLWYDGWLDFAQTHHIQRPTGRTYLSLGDREEKTRNPRMATVGEATRQTAALLAADPNVAETTLIWQEGNHFTNIPGRLAQAILWLMRT